MNPRSIQLALSSLSIAYFTIICGSLCVIALLQPMAHDLATSEVAIAGLVTVFAFGFAVAAPILQVVLARLPRQHILFAGLTLFASGAVITALASSFEVVLWARLLMAVGAAAIGPVASALGAGLVPRERQGRALATVFTGATVAMVVGVPLAAWVGTALSWRAVFWALALLAVLSGCIVALLIRRPIVGPRVYFSTLLAAVKDKAAAWALLVTLLHMASQLVLYALTTIVLQERFGTTPGGNALALMMFGIGGVIGNALGGPLTDRWGAPRTLVLSLALLALVFGLLHVAPAMPAAGIALFALWAGVGMLFQAPQQRRLLTLAPQMGNLLLALNAASLYLGMSLGSFIGSRAYLHFGVPALAPIALLILGVACVAYARSRRAELAAGRAAAADTICSEAAPSELRS